MHNKILSSHSYMIIDDGDVPSNTHFFLLQGTSDQPI